MRRGERASIHQTEGITRDGSGLQVLLTESPILDGAGRMVGTSTIAHDISDLMHAEEGWHSSEELFQNALEFAPFGMCLTSLDGVFLRVNPTLSRMLGRQEEELLAMSWPSLTHPDDLAVSQSAERDLVDGKVPSVEFEKRYVHRDGNIIWVRVRDFLAKNSQGVSTGFVTHIEDITERRRAAEELRRAKEAAEGAEPGEKRVPGEHEPRDSHAHETVFWERPNWPWPASWTLSRGNGWGWRTIAPSR